MSEPIVSIARDRAASSHTARGDGSPSYASVQRLYGRILAAHDAAAAAVRAGESRCVPFLHAVARQVVDGMRDNAAALLAVAPRGDARTESGGVFCAHPANVMLYSTLLARAAGLSRSDQARIGFAALLHDFGRNTEGGDSHPIAMSLLRLGPVEDVASAGAVAASLDASPARALDVASNIVRIACAYDFLNRGDEPSATAHAVTPAPHGESGTTGTSRRSGASPSERAIATLVRSGGDRFDGSLLRCFARALRSAERLDGSPLRGS